MRARAETSGACQDGVAHRIGDTSTFSREHLSDEERVTASLDIKIGGIDAIGGGHPRDRLRCEQRQSHAPPDAGRAELAEQDAQRVAAVESLVAIAENHEQRHGLDPARDETDDVQRRLVRPVHVLDNKNGGSARQPRQQCRGQTVGRHVLLQELRELTTGGRSDVVERTERPGGEQRVAGAPEHADRLRLLSQEATDERRLADACFAAYEDDATTVLPDHGHRRKPLRQLGELALAFEQPPPGVTTAIVHSHSPLRATPVTVLQVVNVA